MSQKDPFDFVKFKLKNGLTIFYSHIPYATKTVVYAAMYTGALDGKRGCSHFLEHLLPEETQLFSGIKDLDIFLENYGGDRIDFYTNYYATTLGISICEKYFNKSLEVIDQVFFQTKLGKNFEREKKVILEEINSAYPRQHIIDHYEKKMRKLVDINIYDFEYRIFHPYVTTGSPEEVRALSLNDLQSHYNQFYAPNNMTLFIGGNLEETQVKSSVQKIFGGYSKKIISKNIAQAQDKQKVLVKELLWDDVEVYERSSLNTSVEFSYSFKGHETWIHRLTRDLLYRILFEFVREKGGLSYNPYVSLNSNKFVGEFNIGFESSHAINAESIKPLLNQVFQKAHKSHKLFDQIKKNLLLRYSYNESTKSIVKSALSDFYYLGKIKTMAMEKKDIKAVCFEDVCSMIKEIKKEGFLEIIRSTHQ